MRYLVVLLLAGCSSGPNWYKAASSDMEFENDKGQCQAQAFGAPTGTTMQFALVYNACMRGKGWRQVE